MNCHNCGKELPGEATRCPSCDQSPYDDKAIPYVDDRTTPHSLPPAAISFPSHFSQGSSMDQQPFLYGAPLLYPIPPQKRQKARVGIIVVIILLVLVLIGTATFALFITRKSDVKAGQSANPYPPYSGKLIINDPLRDNSLEAAHGYHWDNDDDGGTDPYGHCHFVQNSYHVDISSTPDSYMTYCPTMGTNFSKFTYQIQMTILKGNYGGIIFCQAVHARFYAFLVGQDGTYILVLNSGSKAQILAKGTNSAIHQGLNQPNLLAVVANGNKLDLYVNQQLIVSVTDAPLTAGRIGIITIENDSNAVDAVFSDAKVWAIQ